MKSKLCILFFQISHVVHKLLNSIVTRIFCTSQKELDYDFIFTLHDQKHRCNIFFLQCTTVNNETIIDDRPFLDPKEGLPAPKNIFQMAFGDAYCMACRDMKACKDASIIKLMMRIDHQSQVAFSC